MSRFGVVLVFATTLTAIGVNSWAQYCPGTWQLLLGTSEVAGYGYLDRRLRPCGCFRYQLQTAPLPPHLQNAGAVVDVAYQAWTALYPNALNVSGGAGNNCLHSAIKYAMGSSVNAEPWQWGVLEVGHTTQGFGADGYLISFNTDFNLDTLGSSPPSHWTTSATAQANRLHLQTVATHEAGHAFGLMDVNELYLLCSTVMSPGLRGVVKASLLTWDIDAMRRLYSTDVCGTSIGTTWGAIKSLYSGHHWFDGAVALSGFDNTIAWNHLPNDTTRTYFVYRAEGDDEELTLLGTTFGDSLFIDQDTEFGKEYRYHVASADSGDNNQGNRIASGVYFYRLTAGSFRGTKKMVLLR